VLLVMVIQKKAPDKAGLSNSPLYTTKYSYHLEKNRK
jgi:hypothetical protein